MPNHPRAFPAAEAAQCAHAQGKFWEYHDKLFANQGSLGPEDLKRFAADVGLDAKAFDACLESGETQDAIREEAKEAGELGVNATPSFFINGRFLSGAMPYEAFKQIIDDELVR